MPNLFKFADWVCKRGLRDLLNQLEVGQFFNTEYNKEYTRDFAVGETVRVKKPQRWTIRDGMTWTQQPIDRKTVDVTVDNIFGVDFAWDSVEQALKLERGEEEIYQQYMATAIAQIRQEIDSRCAQFAYLNTNNVVGQLGTNPTGLDVYHGARVRMVENAAPPGEKGMIISPAMMASIVVANVAQFNPVNELARAWKEGYYGRAAGFDWYESMSLYSHTAGTWAGTVEMSSGSQSGSSLALTATTGDTFKAGDIINIAGVNNVNPKTRRSTGRLKQFKVMADVTAAASAATISIQPAIVGPGSPYQNVDALPANGADLTLWPGTTSPNGKSGVLGLAIAPDAFALVGVKLQNPKAVEMSSYARDPKTGISIALVQQFDIDDRQLKTRFDVLMGFGALYADESAVLVASLT